MKLRGGLFLFLVSLLLAGSAAGASGKLLGLKTSVDPQGTTLLVRLAGPVEFTPSQVGPRLFLVDVAGVSSDLSSDSQPVESPLISSYRVFSYHGADNRPHMGVELTLKETADVRPALVSDGLAIRVERAGSKPAGAPPAAAKPSSVAKRQPASAPAPKPASSAVVALREVSVVQPENSAGLEVEILADGDLVYRTSTLRNPDRLVLDLPNTVNRIKQTHLDVNTAPLKAVRIAQFRKDPPVSRVVMDLNSQVPFQVRNRAGGLVVALEAPGAAGAANQAGKSSIAPVSTSEAKAVPVKPVFRRPAEAAKPSMAGTQDSAPTATSAPAPAGNLAAAGEPAAPAAEPVLLASNDPSQMVAPVTLTSSPTWKDENDSAEALRPAAIANESPAPAVEAAPGKVTPPPALLSPDSAGANAVARQSSASKTPQSVAESLSSPPVLVAQQRPAAAASLAAPASQQTAQQFTGEPISLNLKDVDLKDFFRLMHEVSGLNVVLDPGVSGVVTIVLDEVPWDQAMDIVLKNNGLEARTIGNVVRIAKVSTLEAEAKAQLAKAQAEAQREEQATPRETVTRPLGYAKANDLVPPLKRFLSARGDIVSDVRTNMLIITDIPEAIAKIDGLINTLDRKTPQVEIEARIVAASRSFARDIGVQLAASGASGNVVLGGAGIVGVSPIARGLTPPLFTGGTPPTDPTQFANLSQPLSVNFGAVGATSGLSLALTAGRNFALDEIITAAESRGLGKLLSRPKIITQNNVEGNVEQGVKIPLQTSVNNTVTVQYQKVTLRLTVTPQITSEGTIFLKTDIENTTIDPGIPRIQGIPALDTQLATTQVLVSDGGTVFFGGVIQTDNQLTEQEVPLLGSIPLVGHLFKRKSTSTTTKELLFFITPKIVQS